MCAYIFNGRPPFMNVETMFVGTKFDYIAFHGYQVW